jgi:hypothetical protein
MNVPASTPPLTERPESPGGIRFGTVIARNFLPYARVLAASLSEHHPAHRLTVLVLDDLQRELKAADEPFDILHPDDIDFGPGEYLPDVGSYHQDYYAPLESSLPDGNGSEFRNRPGYSQRYLGFEFQATKRMADRWMARVGFSSNRHTEHFDGTAGIQDPGASLTWNNINGGAFVTGTAGSGKSEIYLILPRYQITASGMYQFPYGINVAGNLVAREGYGMPFFEPVESADPLLPEKRVLLVDPRDSRLPGVTQFDLRGEKAFVFSGRTLALSLDLFNVFNSSTVLGRQYDVTATGNTGFDQPLEIMNPRLLRLGVRFQF